MEQKDEKKFLSAYDEYADDLFRYCYFRIYERESAKDLVQETFLKTWSFLADGKKIENIRAFLYRVLHNLIVDRARKVKTLSLDRLMEEGFFLEDKNSPGPERESERKEVIKKIAALDEAYRDVIRMRFIDDLSAKEVSVVLGISENAVSVRAHRGMKKLRQLLNTG